MIIRYIEPLHGSTVYFCFSLRTVFTLDGERLTLREVAPGIGLQRDVLDQMEFTPEIDDDLKETDPGALPKPGAGSRA